MLDLPVDRFMETCSDPSPRCLPIVETKSYQKPLLRQTAIFFEEIWPNGGLGARSGGADTSDASDGSDGSEPGAAGSPVLPKALWVSMMSRSTRGFRTLGRNSQA